MKIYQIEIKGVGGIEHIIIKFDPHMNILCGPNGIGKTTILESIAHCFTIGRTMILKRNVLSIESEINAIFDYNGKNEEVNIRFTEFEPSEQASISGRNDFTKYLLSLKTNRVFVYSPLNSIGKDAEKQKHILGEEARHGVNLLDIKNWFVNRYMYSAHFDALSHEQMDNFNLAKKCFSELNSNFSFSRVNASTNEILVNTPSGEIYYEYLSAGFKSCLSILFGIIKEIEYRFQGQEMSAVNFNGVILIDEIELHLHPEWQNKITEALIRIFPNSQFIVSTHSPHIIQSADPNQIIALEFDGGKIALRKLPSSGFGFKGWTLDEVLTDVMGMSDTRSNDFLDLISKFDEATDNENYNLALEIFEKLDASLHPTNHTRKLLKLQLSAIPQFNHD